MNGWWFNRMKKGYVDLSAKPGEYAPFVRKLRVQLILICICWKSIGMIRMVHYIYGDSTQSHKKNVMRALSLTYMLVPVITSTVWKHSISIKHMSLTKLSLFNCLHSTLVVSICYQSRNVNKHNESTVWISFLSISSYFPWFSFSLSLPSSIFLSHTTYIDAIVVLNCICVSHIQCAHHLQLCNGFHSPLIYIANYHDWHDKTI